MPKPTIDSWFQPQTENAAGAASQPTERSTLDDLKNCRTPSCLLDHPLLKRADKLFREHPQSMQSLVSNGTAPFFKRESLTGYSPFKESEYQGQMTQMLPYFRGGIVYGQRDLHSQAIYTFEADPHNDRSYNVEIRREGGKVFQICNDSNDSDPVFSYYLEDETSGNVLDYRCTPTAPSGLRLVYITATLANKRYVGFYESAGEFVNRHLWIDEAGYRPYQDYEEKLESGTVTIKLKGPLSGPSVSLTRKTADGQTSLTFNEGTENDIKTWETTSTSTSLQTAISRLLHSYIP